MDALQRIQRYRSFEGWQEVWQHQSQTTQCSMKFAIYLPPQCLHAKVPVVYWLSGLTCTEQNFITKSGFQRYAAELGLIIVAPDTSPRGCGLPGEDERWDIGSGASFYLNARTQPWNKHYLMYDYITEELPALLRQHFPIADGSAGIAGHSMGGHGALVMGLRQPERYSSISAFAPICAPSKCPWGQKAFSTYLGDNPEDWREYDASLLAAQGFQTPILIDQGANDEFLQEQLRPEELIKVSQSVDGLLQYRLHQDYDHSYYFVATFIEEHLRFHHQQLSENVR